MKSRVSDEYLMEEFGDVLQAILDGNIDKLRRNDGKEQGTR